MANRTKRTPTRKEKFLKALSTGVPNVSRAMKAAGISRTMAYEWRKDDPVFAQQWEDTYQGAVDDMEADAWQRATRRQKPSDVLLIFMLKAHRPNLYKDRSQVEVIKKPEIDDAKDRLAEMFDGAAIPSTE